MIGVVPRTPGAALVRWAKEPSPRCSLPSFPQSSRESIRPAPPGCPPEDCGHDGAETDCSLRVAAKGSPNTVDASSNGTPCRRRLLSALSASHWNRTLFEYHISGFDTSTVAVGRGRPHDHHRRHGRHASELQRHRFGCGAFNNADELRAVARMVPADRFLVETDAPFLAPLPYRGKRNEPAYVVQTAAAVAEARGQTLEEIAAVTRANTERRFRLEPET